MTYATRLKRDPKTFRRLTGITVEKFDAVLAQLRPRYEQWNANRLGRPSRKREPGAGRKERVALEDRFLMLLLYYRTYVTYAFLGFLFQIDTGSPGRMFKPLEPLLADIFKIPERRVELSAEEIRTAFFDGTEQPTNRPSRKQRDWYSGKKKRHTIKHQVIVVKKRKYRGQKRKLRIAAVSKTFEGRRHDKKIEEETRTLSPPGVRKKADLGYKGSPFIIVPKKKPRGKQLAPRWKRANRRHSSERICVEHGIGKMKIWRVCRDQFRGRRKDHALMFKNIAGFHNLMFA